MSERPARADREDRGSAGRRQALLRQAFASFADGDSEGFRALLDPDARWLGIPRGGDGGDTAACPHRAAILELLERHRANGRRFELGRLIERGDRIAAEVTVHNPEWSGPVTIYRVFTFRPDRDVVVRLNDCLDESYALQVLLA